jgi:Domain of unknown function (DUF4263)
METASNLLGVHCSFCLTLTGLVSLLSQLEESKFLRLFRFMASAATKGADSTPIEPVDLPNVEMQMKRVEASRYYDGANWFFQIAHLPGSLWHHENIKAFIEKSLTEAFTDISRRDDLVGAMLGKNVFGRADKNSWPIEWSGYGSDYYFFTNVCGQALTDEYNNYYASRARALFTRIVGVEPTNNPRFGAGTPETFVSFDGERIKSFIVELLNIPSRYYLIAREGRISVAAVTEHGSFFASGGGGNQRSPHPFVATATSTVSKLTDITRQTLSDFEDLLNSRSVREADIQHFIADNHSLLFALDDRYCEVRPHVCLYDANGERLVPDFMVRLEDANIWHAIEIKMPRDSMTVKFNQQQRPSAQTARGIAELFNYRDYFGKRDNRARATRHFGAAPYEPCLVLVIGRDRSAEKYEWVSANRAFPKVDIISYDYLFERARECHARLTPRVVKH